MHTRNNINLSLVHYLSGVMLLVVIDLHGQTFFTEDRIDFNNFYDTVNVGFIRPETDNLATLLVRAYTEGKLKGYTYLWNRTDLKWAPLPKDQWPPPWNPKETYFQDDRVSYKGDGYLMLKEIGPDPTPPDKKKDEYWTRYPLRAEAISKAYTMPSDGDTLSKKEFLTRMIWEQMYRTDPWYPSMEYYAGDLVTFEGEIYQAIQDVTPGQKVSDENYWQPTSRFHLFYSLGDLTGLSVLNYFNAEAKTYIPQMIELRAFDQNAGYAGQQIISFRYCDVVALLNSIPQPLLYATDVGYIGRSRFVLDDKSKIALLTQIQLMLTQTKPGVRDFTVLDQSLFQLFLTAIINEEAPYHIAQDLTTNDLLISRLNKVIARIPVATYLAVAPIRGPRLLRYSDALADPKTFVRISDTLAIDSLSPAPACNPIAQQALGECYWLEEYVLNPLREDESRLLREVWDIILQQTREKRISVSDTWQPNDLVFDWSRHYDATLLAAPRSYIWKRTLTPYYDHLSPLLSDYSDTVNFAGLAVTYEKYFLNDTTPFAAVKLRAFGRCNDVDVGSFFEWETIKQLLLKRDAQKFRKIIKTIETGKIPAATTKLLTGVQELK